MTEIWLLPESTALPNFIYFMGVWNTNEHVWLCNSLFGTPYLCKTSLQRNGMPLQECHIQRPFYPKAMSQESRQLTSSSSRQNKNISQGLTSRSKAQGDSENSLSFMAKVGAAKSNRMRIRRPGPLRFQVQSWQCNNISTVPCTKILS